MIATVLVDNNSGRSGSCELQGEWGLAIHIEYMGRNILLDTGASGLFAVNADKLGIDISAVDLAVLSHAHWDHADGMDVFFSQNKIAPFYISKNAGENCWTIQEDDKTPNGAGLKYDGIKQGWLERYTDRIKYVGDCELFEGCHIVGHSTPGLEERGRKVGQYIMKDDGSLVPDNFAHEQSLVLETDRGLVIFNSCSHGGVDNIIREVEKALHGHTAYAMIGGFHLFLDTEEEVRELAHRIAQVGIKRIITGHCTGEEQYIWLKDELEKCDKDIIVEHMESGLRIEV